MGTFDDNLKLDLYSGDPARVEATIANLRKRMREGDEIEIPPIGAEILSALGDQVPEQTLFDFITLIVRYHSFVPKKSDREKITALVALVLRYLKGDIAFEVALQLKILFELVESVKIAMDE